MHAATDCDVHRGWLPCTLELRGRPPQATRPLMHAEKREPRTVIDRVQPTDVVDFFLNYIDNDQLGRIANGHLALADESPQLANDQRCMELVNLHSLAVDFAKTGVPVDHKKVTQLLRGMTKPDYMAGGLRKCAPLGVCDRLQRPEALLCQYTSISSICQS